MSLTFFRNSIASRENEVTSFRSHADQEKKEAERLRGEVCTLTIKYSVLIGS